MSIPSPGTGGSRAGSSTTIFVEIFVQEVLIDPSDYKFPDPDDPETIPENYKLLTKGITEEELTKAPYNSVVGRIVSANEEGIEVIAYPMIQGHMSLPVKAGEHVWAIFNNGRYYWLCRKNFDNLTDDVAITWAGRYKNTTTARPTSEAASSAESSSSATNPVPSNQNTVINKLFPPEPDDNRKVSMEDFWTARTKSVLEPIPRYKKRPGDLVLQGSNNTLICLGLGGGHKKEDELSISTEAIADRVIDTSDGYSRGTIDIVTGRGRYLPSAATNEKQLGNLPERTACETIISEFGYVEVNKNIGLVEIPPEDKNNIEGDPDFGFDASRIYVSTFSKVDDDFTLIPNYPKIPQVITAEAGAVPETSMGSAVVLKSDNVRIVARNHIGADYFSDGASYEDVNGNIRLVKEGNRDDDGHSLTDGTGASLIALESDGTVMIDGASIVIGTGREEDNGKGNQIFIGAGAVEPIILGNLMTKLLKDFLTDLKTFLSSKYDTHIHPTGTGPSGPPTVIQDDAGTQKAIDALPSTLSKIGMTK